MLSPVVATENASGKFSLTVMTKKKGAESGGFLNLTRSGKAVGSELEEVLTSVFTQVLEGIYEIILALIGDSYYVYPTTVFDYDVHLATVQTLKDYFAENMPSTTADEIKRLQTLNFISAELYPFLKKIRNHITTSYDPLTVVCATGSQKLFITGVDNKCFYIKIVYD